VFSVYVEVFSVYVEVFSVYVEVFSVYVEVFSVYVEVFSSYSSYSELLYLQKHEPCSDSHPGEVGAEQCLQ